MVGTLLAFSNAVSRDSNFTAEEKETFKEELRETFFSSVRKYFSTVLTSVGLA